MTGRRRRMAATVLAVAVTAALWGGSGQKGEARVLSAQPSPSVAPAVQELADCILGSNQLLLLMLVDESGSLAKTDPTNQRVIGAKAALSELVELVNDGRRPTVEVQLAGFSEDFNAATGWTRLDAGSLPSLQAQMDGFSTRNRGLDTDFAMALHGAQASLAARAAALSRAGSAPPCQAMVLFTDGNYDIQPRHVTKFYAPDMYADTTELAARMVAKGRSEVCRPDGLADQLRRDRMINFTVALTGRIGATDRAFLRSMTEGAATGRTCGRRGTPASGRYLGVGGKAGLVKAFHQLASLIGRGREYPGLRPGTRLPFHIDRGLRRFNLLIDLGDEGLVARLRSPGSAQPLVLNRPRRGSAALGSATATYGWLSPTAIAVDVDLPRSTRDWAGRWLVTFTDSSGRPVAADSQIYLFGDLFPELAERPAWRRGETGRLAVRVVDGSGTPQRPAGFVRSAGLEAVVTDPATKARIPIALPDPGLDGVARGRWPVPESLDASRVNLTIRLSVTTSSDLALAPVSRTWPVTVKPPVSYPSIEAAELRLPRLTGKGTTSGTLTVAGGRAGAGCVWFEAPKLKAPASAGPVEVTLDPDATSQSRCLRLAAGARRTVRLIAAPRGEGNGLVEGPLVARLRSDGDSRELTDQVQLRFDVITNPDPGRRLLLFLLILLGGIALPLAALYLLNLFLARLAPTDLLRVAAVPVLVDGDRVHRRTVDGSVGALLTELRPEEFANAEAGSPARLRSLGLGALWLRTRVPRLPFTAPYAEAAADGYHVTAAEGRLAGRPFARGKLPLELGGTWVFVLEEPTPEAGGGGGPDGQRVDGTLYALLDEPLENQGERLAEAAQRDLPAAAEELAAVAAASRPPASGGPGAEDEPEPVSQDPVPVEPDY